MVIPIYRNFLLFCDEYGHFFGIYRAKSGRNRFPEAKKQANDSDESFN